MRQIRPGVRSAIATFIAIGVALATGSAGLLGIGHLVSAPHVLCPEHGELEDMASAPHVGEVVKDEPTIGNRADSQSHDRHEHCAFASHAHHTPVANTFRPWNGTALQVQERPVPVLPVLPTSLRALYRLAPKTSPPV